MQPGGHSKELWTESDFAESEFELFPQETYLSPRNRSLAQHNHPSRHAFSKRVRPTCLRSQCVAPFPLFSMTAQSQRAHSVLAHLRYDGLNRLLQRLNLSVSRPLASGEPNVMIHDRSLLARPRERHH